jgi:hypothetical protein
MPRQKITFAEMRASGVRGLLIYCSDYQCSHWTAITATDGPMTSGCPVWSPSSPAKPAAGKALMSAPISIGKPMPGARNGDAHALCTRAAGSLLKGQLGL